MIKLSELDGVFSGDVAEALDIHARFHCSAHLIVRKMIEIISNCDQQERLKIMCFEFSRDKPHLALKPFIFPLFLLE